MIPTWLRPLAPRSSKNSNRRRSGAKRPRSTRPFLELLEDRLAPATFIWDGGAGSGNTAWGTGQNWVGDVAPVGTGAVTEDLVFPLNAPVNSMNSFTGGVFNSITFQGSGYNITGNTLTLGPVADPNGGRITANAGAANNTIALNVQLSGVAGSQQIFTVGSGSSVTITGQLSGSTGVGITKEGVGILTLTADNSSYTGAITAKTGILAITNNNALGNIAAGTTVLTNAQLQVAGNALTISENIIINGPGISNDGAILNTTGANTWAGTVTMDANSTLGANANTTLTITGVVGDLGSGHDVSKEGQGTVVFATNNTYRGFTSVDDGTLIIRAPRALGPDATAGGGTAATGTLVNQTLTKVGTLQLEDPNNPTNNPTIVGFTVLDEILTLNGFGFGSRGALRNQQGNNQWAGSIIIGSPAPNGSDVDIVAAGNTTLTISGVVSDPNGAYGLSFGGPGKIILNNNNTYDGNSSIFGNAIVSVRDSHGLGPNNSGFGSGDTNVQPGSAIWLEVDVGLDPHGRDLALDSVTGFFGNGPQLGLRVDEEFLLNGTGNNVTGALRSVSGINQVVNDVILSTIVGDPAIGVDADPNPSNTEAYFTDDYSLTITGNVTDNFGLVGNLRKRGAGHLIFPNNKSYTGRTEIEQGWMTIRTDVGLGGLQGGGDTIQPAATVYVGAALHLRPLTAGGNLNLLKNLVLGGQGIVHPFALINQRGALESLGGTNVIGGPVGGRVSYVKLNGQAGIGVEQLSSSLTGQLTITTSISDFNSSNPGGIDKSGSRQLILQGEGTYTGAVNVNEGVIRVENDFALGTASSGTAATGTEAYTTTTTSVLDGQSELQRFTVTGTTGTFTLTFNGQTTNALNFDATPAQVKTELELLSTIGGVGGTVNVALLGTAEAQRVTVGNTGGNFTLTFNGATTPQLSGGATAAQVSAALNGLSTINGLGGFVTVSKSGNVFTVTFQGNLRYRDLPLIVGAGTANITVAEVPTTGKGTAIYTVQFGGSLIGNQPQLTVLGSGGATISNVGTLLEGDGSALEIGSTPPLNNGGVSEGVSVWYERLVLSGFGNATFGDAALDVRSSDNFWQGPVTIRNSTLVHVEPVARMILFGNMDDGNNPGDITLAGGGQLILSGANTYRGSTFVNEGLLVLQNSTALGGTGISEVQTVTLSGATTGDFTLTFNGQTTASLPFAATATDVENALNALSTVRGPATTGVGGAATVTRSGNVFTITFGGSLLGFNQNALVAAGGSGAIADVATTRQGTGGTIVADGATLQLQSSLTVAGEPLMLQGQGTTLPTNLPVGWVPLGPAPINVFPTAGNQAVTGRVTATVADPTDSNVLYMSTAAGGVWKSINGGQTWLPLFDFRIGQDEVQTVTISGGASGTFTLTFDGATTAALPVGASALQVQTALNALSTIGGLDGFVIVTTNATGNAYTITFQGVLAGTDVSDLTGTDPTVSGTTTINTVTQGIESDTPMYIGTIVLDPANPRTIYIGTGEANNTGDSFYGTGIYRSTDSGRTWALFGGTPVQLVTVTGTMGTFTLSFGGDTTNPIAYNAPASTVQTELNLLPSIAAIGGVTVTASGTTIYTVTFSGATTNIPLLVGAPTTGDPRALVTEQSPFNPFDGKGINKIVIDPNSAANNRTMYVADADGGLGQNEIQQLRINGLSIGQTFTLTFTGPDSTGAIVSLTTGAITFAGSNNNTQRTQTAANIQAALQSLGNIGGVGGLVTVTFTTGGGTRYRITFSGTLSQTNVQQLTTSLPTISPTNPISTPREGGPQGVINGSGGGAGIWRLLNGSWVNITRIVSTNRSTTASTNSAPPTPNPPNSPGPDDDYTITFTSTGANWSDVALVYTDITNTGGGIPVPVLYAALGTAGGSFPPAPNNNGVNANGVYWSENPQSNTPIWYVGKPGGTDANPATAPTQVDVRDSGEFPRGAGNIKIGAVAGTTLITTTIYASTATPFGSLLAVYKSSNGGHTWAATSSPGNYMANQGQNSNAILVQNASTVYVAGYETNSTSHLLHILRSTDGGSSWADLSVLGGRGPQTGTHAMRFDSTGLNPRVLVSTNGGLWRLETNNTWTDLNGNLAISQINSVAAHPTNLSIAFAGVQHNGTAAFTNGLSWTTSDPVGGTGGQVRIDPKNPSNIFHVLQTTTTTASIRRSTNGGTTWSTVLNTTASTAAALGLDAINTSRLLAGGNSILDGLRESLNQGITWISLNSPIGVTALAFATYQGVFAADSDFALVTDQGSSTYDPDTIYVTNGTIVSLTKNHGVTWQDRSTGTEIDGLGLISDIVVDPRNRDTAYVVRSDFVDQVFMTTTAGQAIGANPAWTDITFDLPAVPVWKLVLDPRSGNIYVGTDEGVYLLKSGTTSWRRFGEGMPNVQVRDLELNQTTNTLLAGTYGRSVFRLWLDDSLADPTVLNAGALRITSGTSVWSGPVILAGPTTIRVDGTQDVATGVSTGQLILQGVVSDAMADGDYTLTKTGQGNLFLAGSNIYGGQTNVLEGALAVQNTRALGQADQTTVVSAGAQLQLHSDLDDEPIILSGNGITFNDHNSGALRNFAGNNEYRNGSITLMTNVTIGADSGSSLRISRTMDSNPVITDGMGSFNLTKELTGTIELASANDYDGLTTVNQGVLRVSHAMALGSTAMGTTVIDGAQIQMAGNVTVVDETLRLSGTGLVGTGAMLNFSGDNTWQGNIQLASIPGFNPPTTPPNFVSFGANVNSSLTIDGVIDEPTGNFGLTKVGPGKLILTQDNQYNRLTDIVAGVLNVRHGDALGTPGAGNQGTIVRDGAALEIESATSITVGGEDLTLNGTGIGNTGALRNVGGNNVFDGDITLATATVIGVDMGSSLDLTGLVRDPTPVPAIPATLDKVGGGTLIFSNNNTYTGLTTITTGNLRVNGSTGDIRLDGGTLSGTGTVENVASASGGTVNPGVTTGMLTAANVNWNATTTFFVDLTDLSNFDQLAVTGAIDLGSAILDGTAANTVIVGNVFTIITANTLTGTFTGVNDSLVFTTLNDLDIIRLGGRRFLIDYDYTAGTVTLTAQKAFSTTMVTASPSNPEFGDTITFTATVTPNFPVPTGTITFTDVTTGMMLGTDALDGSGQASIDVSNLQAGTHTIRADFPTDFNYEASFGTLVITVAPRTTMTDIITDHVAGSVYGEQVTFTATVTATLTNVGGSLTPVGNVKFEDLTTGADLGTFALNGSGQRSIMLNTLMVGPHNIRASFIATTNFAGSSDTVTQTVNQGTTTMDLTSSLNPSIFGNAVTFTATVTANAPSTLDPAGIITIVDTTTGATLGSGAPDSNGVFAVTISTLDSGNHVIEATYTDPASQYADSSDMLTQMVNPVTTTTTLSSSVDPSMYGDSVTFTAVVSPTSGTATPTGSVVFNVDGSDVFTTSVDTSGNAQYTTATLPAGMHPVFARYVSNSVNFTNSTSNTVMQDVDPRATTTTVVSSDSDVFPTQPVTFTATVSQQGGSFVPTGAVQFQIDGIDFGAPVALNGSGQATSNSTSFPTATPASHTITANYVNADGNFVNSSGMTTQLVHQVTTSTVVVSSDSTAYPTQLVTFTATVSANEAGTPTGTVQFQIDGVDFGAPVTLNGAGQATSNSTSFPTATPATHTITANYTPATVVFAGSSGQTTQNVAAVVTTTTVSSSANPSAPNQAVTFTALVTAPEAGTPTGTVQFQIDSTNFGAPVTLDGTGRATSNSMTFTTPATHDIRAIYTPATTVFATSTGQLNQVVQGVATTTTLTSSDPFSDLGAPVTFTALVTAPVLGPPTGTVTFRIDGGSPTTVALDGTGRARFTTSTLSVGLHTISANYTPSTNTFLASVAVTNQTVTKDFLAVGTDGNRPALVNVYDPANGALVATISPFAGYSGPVRTAVGDINGDGLGDIVVVSGPGAMGHVKVFSGANFNQLLASFFAFTNFNGGVTAAVGDVDGDGRDDIAVGTAAAGVSSHVKVYSGANLGELLSFLPYGAGFIGGLSVAIGDLNGDGRGDIITGAGINAHIKVFNGATLGASPQELASFLAYGFGFTGGSSVASGDIDGDGRAEIITSATSAAPHVKVFDLAQSLRASYLMPPGATQGTRVDTVDRNSNGRADIVTRSVGSNQIRIQDGLSLALLDNFFAFS